jgi:putative addiction module killer protein
MKTTSVQLHIYQDEFGSKPFMNWLMGIRDSLVKARIQVRLDRVEEGNFGDHKALGGGICEIRIDFGPGYRVYYGRHGESFVLLLGGGDKKSQTRDIEKARKYWSDFLRRGVK